MSIRKTVTELQSIYYIKYGPHWYAFTRRKWYAPRGTKEVYTYNNEWYIKRSRSLYYLRKKVGRLHETQEICPLQFLVETGLDHTKCYDMYALVV